MIWLDAHISPAVAQWVSADLGYPACSVRDLLKKTLPRAMDLIAKGDKLVEISGKA